MVQFDLTDTALASADESACVPSEAELTVLTVALLLESQRAFCHSNGRELVLTASNIDAVADVLRSRLAPLHADLERTTDLRSRLRELIGIRIHLEQGERC